MSDDGKIILAVNGEIYNHLKMRESLKSHYAFKTHSDCEVIIPLVRTPRASPIPAPDSFRLLPLEISG